MPGDTQVQLRGLSLDSGVLEQRARSEKGPESPPGGPCLRGHELSCLPPERAGCVVGGGCAQWPPWRSHRTSCLAEELSQGWALWCLGLRSFCFEPDPVASSPGAWRPEPPCGAEASPTLCPQPRHGAEMGKVLSCVKSCSFPATSTSARPAMWLLPALAPRGTRAEGCELLQPLVPRLSDGHSRPLKLPWVPRAPAQPPNKPACQRKDQVCQARVDVSSFFLSRCFAGLPAGPCNPCKMSRSLGDSVHR